MPDDPSAAPPAGVDNATLIAAFLSEGHQPDDAPEPAAKPAKADATEAVAEEAEAESTEDPPAEGDATTDAATDTDAADESVYDTVAITAAIEKRDPRALIEALGDAAEELLGSKAHKALRLQATELKKTEAKNKKFETYLEDKYGDPIKARAAAASGDINAFVENIERQFGAPWTAMVKAVNDAFAGKPARIENVAEAAKRADLEQATKRDQAQAKVRADITRVATASEPALAKACPRLTELVYEKMRTGWNQGIRTPAKALALVKKDLATESAAISKLFAPKKAAKTPPVRPPRQERETPGRPQTDAEMREEFLRAEGLWRGA